MNLLYSNKSVRKIVSTLNKDLSNLQDWFRANKLTVNLTKTKYIHFGSKQRIRNVMVNESDLTLTLGQPIQKLPI